jgi:hypothetical protein
MTSHPHPLARRGARRPRRRLALFALPLVALLPGTAYAHVKWFTDFSFADRPRTLAEVLTPTFLALAALGAVAVGLLVLLDRAISGSAWYRRVDDWLAQRRDASVAVLRVALGAALLLAWQADTLLAPDLHPVPAWMGWAEFAVVPLLLFPATVPLAGVGVVLLYLLGALTFGPFYVLDYVFYAGAGYYLAVAGSQVRGLRGTGVPALYLTVGFSLCWVALEKLVYPQWGLYLLQEHPLLALGLPADFFLTGAAFVEFTLGYLLIIGLLGRPLALIITLVFFSTTLVFGKLEVIGHTPVHGALIVFLLEGSGRVYPPPIALHSRIPLRMAFGAVNFLLLLGALLVPYAAAAWDHYATAAAG